MNTKHLKRLIRDYRDASIANSEKGGGDPVAIPEIEQRLQICTLQLNAEIERIDKELKDAEVHL